MKSLISLKLILVLLISSLSSWAPIALASNNTSTCENGECVPGLVRRLENLNSAYKAQCLPRNIKHVDIPKYHDENPLTEECWKFITEISHLEEQLQNHQTRLEGKLGCSNGECSVENTTQGINAQLANLSKVEQELSCSPAKVRAVERQCAADTTCVLISSAMGVGGYLLEMIAPDNAKPKGCNLGNDSCTTHLATGFLKSVVSLFKGAWDLLKIAGRKTGEGLTEFWNWVSGGEDHSATSQLALAKASEDPSIFNELVNDFPGAMKKIWNAFVATMKHWMKNGVFCQKWSGVPQFSQCLQPVEDFDCISCKGVLTGLCSISGTIIAEVVPAFLSGGATVAIKQGVNAASKLARGIRVSQKSLEAIKASSVGRVALQASSKADEALKISRSLNITKNIITGALAAIKTYMLSPARRAAKASLAAMIQATRKGKIYLASTPRGRVILFGGQTLKTGARIVLYPIDNPLTSFAYRAGYRSFDRVFKLGKPTLGIQTAVTASLTQKTPDLELMMAQIDELKIAGKGGTDRALKLETEYLHRIEPLRLDALKTTLSKGESELSEIINRLYPELDYGDLARFRPKEKILAAEEELYIEISNLPNSVYKDKIFRQYEEYFAVGERRMQIVGEVRIPPHSKIEIGKALESFTTKADRKFYVVVEQAAGQYSFKVTDLAQKEAGRLADALGDSDGVLLSLERNLNLGKNKAIIEMKSGPDGKIDIKNIKLESAPITYEPPDIAPMNFTGAFTKFVSPTFKTAGASEEDRKKKETERKARAAQPE